MSLDDDRHGNEGLGAGGAADPAATNPMGCGICDCVRIFGLAWWLRGHWAKERLEARGERLDLLKEQLADVQSKLANAEGKLDALQREITAFRETPSFARLPPETRVRVDGLAKRNTEVREALSSVAASTTALDEALNRFYTTSSTLHAGTPTYYLLKGDEYQKPR